MRKTAKVTEAFIGQLFAPNAPLSTFSSRIKLAYGYGLISAEDRSDFDVMRDIRNDAAHTTELFSFYLPKVRESVKRLTAPTRFQKQFPTIKVDDRIQRGLAKPKENARDCVLVGCFFLNVFLVDKIMSVLLDNWNDIKKTFIVEASKGCETGP